MIFNIVIDAVVLVVLEEVFRPQESHHGMGWEAEEKNIFFNSDEIRIAGQDYE